MLFRSSLDFNTQLCILTSDSLHATTGCRRQAVAHDNLVMLTRMRGNRNVYSQPGPDSGKKRFGEKMKLNKKDSHRPPDTVEYQEITMAKGKQQKILLKTWKDMMVRGEAGFRAYEHPFTLIKASFLDSEGQETHKKPMWLMALGKRRCELESLDVFTCYRQRYDIEHYFRFGKQRLLLDKFQTPDTRHEENWWQLAQLAYIQLYLARDTSKNLPYPWERLPSRQGGVCTPPAHVMRDFFRIQQATGTPARAPKVRGIGLGRSQKESQKQRPDNAVIYKSRKKKCSEKKTAPTLKKSTGFENKGDLPKTDNLTEILLTVRELLQKISMTPEEFLENARLVLLA